MSDILEQRIEEIVSEFFKRNGTGLVQMIAFHTQRTKDQTLIGVKEVEYISPIHGSTVFKAPSARHEMGLPVIPPVHTSFEDATRDIVKTMLYKGCFDTKEDALYRKRARINRELEKAKQRVVKLENDLAKLG